MPDWNPVDNISDAVDQLGRLVVALQTPTERVLASLTRSVQMIEGTTVPELNKVAQGIVRRSEQTKDILAEAKSVAAGAGEVVAEAKGIVAHVKGGGELLIRIKAQDDGSNEIRVRIGAP